jgi:carbonic anhydrase
MHIRSDFLQAVICCILLPGAHGVTQQPQHEHVWDYEQAQGPSHWGELKPEFAPCKTGHRQSPIDIENPRKADLPAIEFDYKLSPLHIIDNGHTIMINYAPGSFIWVGGKKYALKQFHFHRPSEEKINGKGYEMSLHLVHANQEGDMAVVAVLLEKGQQNPVVREVWNDLPKQKEKEEMFDNVQINATGLLPTDRSYYTYAGSLTTPPCTENVMWFVLKHPVTISNEDIERFSRLYRHDARPTQPIYDRIVLAGC